MHASSGKDFCKGNAHVFISSLHDLLRALHLTFPFLLKELSISSNSLDEKKGFIACDEWLISTITEKQMADPSMSYTASNVESILRKVEGGITSDMVKLEIDRYSFFFLCKLML